VRSIKHECLNRMVPLGEHHVRRALKEFVDHYHRERNHQGLANRRIDGSAAGPLGRPLGHYAPAKTLNYARRRSEARNRAVSASQSPISVSCMSE